MKPKSWKSKPCGARYLGQHVALLTGKMDGRDYVIAIYERGGEWFLAGTDL